MRWTYVLCAALVAGGLIPGAGAQDPLCVPVADPAAEQIGDRYYLETVDGFEIWRETNGIAGLQENSEMACGAAADFQWVDLGASSL